MNYRSESLVNYQWISRLFVINFVPWEISAWTTRRHVGAELEYLESVVRPL